MRHVVFLISRTVSTIHQTSGIPHFLVVIVTCTTCASQKSQSFHQIFWRCAIPPVSFDLPEDVCFGMPDNMLRLLNIWTALLENFFFELKRFQQINQTLVTTVFIHNLFPLYMPQRSFHSSTVAH